jgi:GrpB-like predicted nucleotidyltransferase (UPF0157 family)
MDQPIHIEPYHADWPVRFESECALLTPILAPWLAGPIEHVGSTAVLGLAAKPTIDVMAAVYNLEHSRPALTELERVGYCYAPYQEDVMHWLCKPNPAVRTHHLHLVPYGSQVWQERILFRDRLRTDIRLAESYANLKRNLARLHENDREAYTQAKSSFIREAIARAA